MPSEGLLTTSSAASAPVTRAAPSSSDRWIAPLLDQPAERQGEDDGGDEERLHEHHAPDAERDRLGNEADPLRERARAARSAA